MKLFLFTLLAVAIPIAALPVPGAAKSQPPVPESWAAQLGKKVTIVGRAENAKLGALLVTGSGSFYLKGKDAWETDLLKRTLRVTGKLVEVQSPVATQEHGAWSAGVTGPGRAFALEDYRWQAVDATAEQLEWLKDSDRSPTEKWELCRKIQAQGLVALPSLVACVGDPAPIGKTPMTGGECINLPVTVTPPPQCRNPVRTETLGERCELMLYNILTPAYTSPYMTPLTSKQAPPRPFVVRDWEKWWRHHQSDSLEQIHQEARGKIDEFWLHNPRASIPWD